MLRKLHFHAINKYCWLLHPHLHSSENLPVYINTIAHSNSSRSFAYSNTSRLHTYHIHFKSSSRSAYYSIARLYQTIANPTILARPPIATITIAIGSITNLLQLILLLLLLLLLLLSLPLPPPPPPYD